MRFDYFTDSDTLVIKFKHGRVDETVDVTTGVLAHLDTDGTIMGFEIDVASRHLKNFDLTSDAPDITYTVDPKGILEPAGNSHGYTG